MDVGLLNVVTDVVGATLLGRWIPMRCYRRCRSYAPWTLDSDALLQTLSELRSYNKASKNIVLDSIEVTLLYPLPRQFLRHRNRRPLSHHIHLPLRIISRTIRHQFKSGTLYNLHLHKQFFFKRNRCIKRCRNGC